MRERDGTETPDVAPFSAGLRHRFARWHRAPAIALVVVLALTAVAGFVTSSIINSQDHRLLNERANEVDLVFASAVSTLPTTLAGLGGVARDGGTALFDKEAAADITPGTNDLTFALARPDGPEYLVVAAAGSGLRVGELVSGPREATMALAQKRGVVVATPVLGSGKDRLLGFALGGASAPKGMVVYRQSNLGPVKAPRQSGTAPFQGLEVALYGTSRPITAQVLVTTTQKLPLHDAAYEPLLAGASHWLVAVSSRGPLVGSVAAWAPWGVALTGIVGAVLISQLLEQEVRRREAAIALYQSEHRLAETLQTKLLPVLPSLNGLDIASCYVAAADGQQVGGDWFDVFELGDGRTAVVIGDVMGHDIEAAAAMAQVRAALRAYAFEGGEPATVIERLARLVEVFDITGLVTVVYGVLDAGKDQGTRLFRWANAGHLPPFLQTPTGQVMELLEGASMVIGAPDLASRAQGERHLEAGSTLVLYTDGLVELPGTPLADSIEQLRQAVEAQGSKGSASELCRRIVGTRASVARDDIAIMVVRVPLAPPSPTTSAPAGSLRPTQSKLRGGPEGLTPTARRRSSVAGTAGTVLPRPARALATSGRPRRSYRRRDGNARPVGERSRQKYQHRSR